MRSIVAALSVLIVCSATAQSVKPAVPEIRVNEPEQIQLEQMAVPEIDIRSDSTIATVATNTIPDAPRPMPMAAAFIRATSTSSSRSAEFRKFQSDNFNRILVAAEFGARGIDALSTRNKLNNPCRCYREASRFFGLDMTPVFKSDMGAYSYSFGVATVYSIISAKLWNASKNHPRHAPLLRRLSRSLLIGDSSMEIVTDVHNFSLRHPGPSNR